MSPLRNTSKDRLWKDEFSVFTSDERYVTRRQFTKFHAFSQKCTHLSCAVYYDRETNRLACPCHHGYFSAKDGSVLQGPPPRPLPRIVLERQEQELVAIGVKVG
jgi:arsenite oxidase small subunit